MRFPYLVLASATAISLLVYVFYAHSRQNLTDSSRDKRKPSVENLSSNRVEPSFARQQQAAPRPSRMPVGAPVYRNAAETKLVTNKPLRRKQRLKVQGSASTQNAVDLPAAPFVNPVDSQKAAAYAARVKTPAVGRPPAKNPLDDRWVGHLSGGGAHLSVRRQAAQRPCPNYECERETPKDLNVVGVVVRQERLMGPQPTVMTGDVKRGHYIEKTPAVYIE